MLRFSALLTLAALSACAQLSELMEGESVDYRSTVRGEPLTIPPDLTQVNRDAQYRTADGATTFSQYAGSQTQAVAPDARILPQPSDMMIMRDGSLRWLSVDRSAEDVYPQVVDFWLEQGFTIFSQNPATGLIETDWAENRKKIPESWLRSVLTIIDQVFDSGERERFRTRLERVNGKTEVYISHEQMVETPVDESTFRWIPGKEDPNLNAAMLARLMVFLGSDEGQARRKIAQPQDVAPAISPVQSAQGPQTALTLAEPFDRAWRRVGIAIDAAGFSLEDRDRSTGDYYIRYLDTDTGVKRETGNFFTRLFGSSSSTEADQFRIHVDDQGASAVVTVRNPQGQRDDSVTAQRILSVLSGQMTGR